MVDLFPFDLKNRILSSIYILYKTLGQGLAERLESLGCQPVERFVPAGVCPSECH